MQSSLLVARGHGGSCTWRIAGYAKSHTLPALWVLSPTRPAAPDRSRRASQRRHLSLRSSADAAANAWSSRASIRASSSRSRSSCSRVWAAGCSPVQGTVSTAITRTGARCTKPLRWRIVRVTIHTFLRSASFARRPSHLLCSASRVSFGTALARPR